MRFLWKNVSKKELIISAKNIHKNKYNYLIDDLNIINSNTKLKILCNKCNNIFYQSIKKHIIQSQNCSCYSNKKLTILDIITKSKLKHGDNSFNYSKLQELSNNDIINNKTKIPLICNKGHFFKQQISNHLNGQKCSICCKNKKINKFDLIKQFNIVHKNKYNYSLIKDEDIKNNKSKISIICTLHDEKYIFHQTISSHKSGHGCSWCAKQKKLSYNYLIINNKYYYDLSLNKNKEIKSTSKISIICNKHIKPVVFKQTASYFLNGGKCPICFQSKQKLNKNMLDIKSYETFNCNNYEYLINEALITDKIKIKCKKHNYIFTQYLSNHFNKHIGCKKCFIPSKQETKWLDSLNIKEENRQISLPGLSKKIKVDGYDPETNTVYEFLGSYYHGDPIKYNLNDYNHKVKKNFIQLYKETIKREIKIRKAGYNYQFIWENDWKTNE